MHRLKLSPVLLDRRVSAISRGNQQKVVFSRAFLRNTKVLIPDEPTVGVDVGARLEFYNIMKELCEGGAAILLISSDLQEIIHLSNRVYTLSFGNLRLVPPSVNGGDDLEVRTLKIQQVADPKSDCGADES